MTFSESEVVTLWVKCLKDSGWIVKEHILVEGEMIDIFAEKEGNMLLLEAKGEDGSGYPSAEMNFLVGLGQLMTRMKNDEVNYGLAFPFTRDFIKVLKKYKGSFAFEKLGIYLAPVRKDGSCSLVPPIDAIIFIEKI